jgi:hypothetical protein
MFVIDHLIIYAPIIKKKSPVFTATAPGIIENKVLLIVPFAETDNVPVAPAVVCVV